MITCKYSNLLMLLFGTTGLILREYKTIQMYSNKIYRKYILRQNEMFHQFALWDSKCAVDPADHKNSAKTLSNAPLGTGGHYVPDEMF